MKLTGLEGSRSSDKWQSVLVRMDGRAVERLLQILSRENIVVRRGPETGFLMMTARDASENDFHMGEVLVTEAEVDYCGRRGYAIVMGNEPEKAMVRAAVEVILAGGDMALVGRIERILSVEAKKQTAASRRASDLLASTKVNFETMPKG
jgi:alpha-D-ribose 1-methylphosphonate 5-triphosphate synthase subunit PhnG